MYATDFICTYKLIDDEFKDALYQMQLLQAFDLEKYDTEKMNSIIEDIYKELECNEKFKKIISNHPEYDTKFSSLTLVILFSYDTFDLFHLCLVDYYSKGDISDERMNALLNKYKEMNK